MLGFSKKKPNVFRWTPNTIASFRGNFRTPEDSVRARYQIDAFITQQVQTLEGWGNSRDVHYYGWAVSSIHDGNNRVDRIPFEIDITKNEDEFVERDPRDRPSLKRIGNCYLWKRHDEGPDGLQFSFWLDHRRFRTLGRSLARHASGRLAPKLTIELSLSSEENRDPKEFDIGTYWARTVPIDLDKTRHPFA